MAVKRDLAAEQRAVGQFRAANGNRLPDLNNPKERATVYRMAYPPQGGLPDELKASVDQSLYAGGATPATTPNALSQTVAGSNIGQLQADVANAQAGVEKMSQPNEALRVLQEAVRAKSGIAEQPLGTSDVFKKAGLTGMGSLNASLNETNNKFVSDMADFKNVIGTMAGTYKDMATAAVNKYEMAYTAFKDESDRLQKIQDDINQHKDAIEMMNLQYQNSLKLEAYKRANPDIADVLTAREAGLASDGKGGWTKDVSGADVNSIANAIKQVESGGNYNAKGASGENGAYQFMPSTWKSWSTEYASQVLGKSQKLEMTPENQDAVAKFKIGQWLSQGMTPQQIAAKWNSGSEVGWENKIGTNSQGVVYNVPAYVNKVVNVLSQQVNVGDKSSAVNSLSPLAKQIYTGEASMDGLTPTAQTKIKQEIAKAGLVLQNLSTNDKTRIDKIVGQFDNEAIVKNYSVIAEGYDFAKSLSNTSTSPSDDQGLIYAFAKAMDPNSVVREGEYATVQKYAQSWKDSFKFNAIRVVNNVEFLTPEARKNMKATIKKKFEASQRQYDNIFNEYGRRIEKISGSDGKSYLTDYSKASGSEFLVVAPDGNTYEFDTQEDLNNFKKEAGIK